MLDIEALQAINRDVVRGLTQLSIISTTTKKYNDMVNVSTILLLLLLFFFIVVRSAFSVLIFILKNQNMLTPL